MDLVMAGGNTAFRFGPGTQGQLEEHILCLNVSNPEPNDVQCLAGCLLRTP